jgi:hypothetical protein
MARRPSLIKLKQKKQKQSKTEQYLINRKYCGEEPTYTSAELTATKHHAVLSWYNYMCDLKDAKEYLQTYLKNTGRDAELKRLREVPDKWYSTTACWNARIMSRGGTLPEASKKFFETRLAEMLNRDYSKAGRMDASEEEARNSKA